MTLDKTTEQLALRGKLDTLNAQIVLMQALSSNKDYISDLEEIRQVVRKLQHCEASGSSFEGDFTLCGITADKLHSLSHNPKDGHIMPHCDMKQEAASLNLLRTLIRETELASCRAFPGDNLRLSHILNRLSSAAYVLTFKYLPENYPHRLTFGKS